jgi:hypothetical protein
MPSDFSVVAIIAAYNEADIIEHVVRDLIDQGIHVCFLDDGSTDRTVAAVEPYLGRGVLRIEHLATSAQDAAPPGFEWERILRRKTELARELDASWFIHHDADEFRESPWSHLSLLDAIRRVDALGFNAIDFAGLDFWPVHDRFRAGDDVRDAFQSYAEPAPCDRLQVRCWKKTDDLDLASSGGHEVRFHGRKIFPVRFILRHYPIRGQAHGERKVFHERRNRFLEHERARGWHVQYDELREGESFVRDPSALTPYDPDAVRLALTLRHRGVEALEASLGESRSLEGTLRGELQSARGELARMCADAAGLRDELEERAVELAGTRAELQARNADLKTRSVELHAKNAELGVRSAQLLATNAEIARLRDALEQRLAEIERWRASLDDAVRRLDAFEHSLTWRWTSPARAAYRFLAGR